MIIDISKYQGTCNWKQIKEAGVNKVFIKATEGVGSKNDLVKLQADGAKAAGLLIGYYHFASLNNKDEVGDAVQEVNYFTSVLETLPKNDLPLVLDIEKNLIGLSKDEVLAYIKAFFSQLETLGYKDYVLYSYTPFLDSNLPINHGLGNVRLWIAAYTDTLKLPKGWTNYWLWQYSSKGQVLGIKGNVDLNREPK